MKNRDYPNMTDKQVINGLKRNNRFLEKMLQDTETDLLKWKALFWCMTCVFLITFFTLYK